MNLQLDDSNCLSTEVIKLGERLDKFENQIKTTFTQIDNRDIQVLDLGKTVSTIYKEIHNRSTVLQHYADTVLEKGKELYESQLKFEQQINNKSNKISTEEEELRNKLQELHKKSGFNVKQKTELSKTLTNLTKQLKQLTSQDGELEELGGKHNSRLSASLSNNNLSNPDLLQSDLKHYQQLIEDTNNEIDTYSKLLVQRDEALAKVKSSISYHQGLSEMIDKVCDLASSMKGMELDHHDIIEQEKMYESEIQRKKYKIEKYIRKRLEILEKLSEMRVYQGSSIYNRSNLRQSALEDETSMIEEELNESKSQLEIVISDKAKQEKIIDDLKKELGDVDKELQNIEEDNNRIYNFIDELDQSIFDDNNSDIEYNEQSNKLYQELNELKNILKIEISKSDQVKSFEDDIINSDKIIDEKCRQRKLTTSLQLSLNKAQKDVSEVLEEINHTMESIEIMEHEKVKLLNDAKSIHKKKAENKILSQNRSYNDEKVYLLTKSVSQLENVTNKMSKAISKRKDNMKKRIFEENSFSKSAIDIKKNLSSYRDRVATAERVAKVMTYISKNISKQLQDWKKFKKEDIGQNEINSAEEWCTKLDKIVRRADDLATWVQVFGKHNNF